MDITYINLNPQIPIQVLPVDDEVPQIFVNTGLYIEAAVAEERPEWKYLTNKNLRAEDIDSPNGKDWSDSKANVPPLSC